MSPYHPLLAHRMEVAGDRTPWDSHGRGLERCLGIAQLLGVYSASQGVGADERPVKSFLDGKAGRHHPLIRPCYLVSVLITLKLLIACLDYYRRLTMLVQIPEGGAHDTSKCVGHWMPHIKTELFGVPKSVSVAMFLTSQG